jgi:hypothetical protein
MKNYSNEINNNNKINNNNERCSNNFFLYVFVENETVQAGGASTEGANFTGINFSNTFALHFEMNRLF